MNLKINGILVCFTQGIIAASKKDATITHEVTQGKEAGDDAGIWSNKLFPPSTCGKMNSYTRLRRHLGSIRHWHYNSTYHFEESVWRIVPDRRVAAYRQTVEVDGKAEALQLLNDFINDLPNLIDLAKLGRGKAFKQADYPTPEQIREKFVYEVCFRPIPDGSGLNSELMQDHVDKLNELHARRLAEANQTLIRRFLDPLKTLGEQLQDPTKRRLKTVLETIQEVTAAVPSLDLSGNDELVNMAEQIHAVFADVTPEALKQDDAMRKLLGETVQTAITSLDRFGKFDRKFA